MEENILEKLLNERYSAKQMVSYFIIGFKDTENKNEFEEIMNNVTTAIVNIDKNKLPVQAKRENIFKRVFTRIMKIFHIK